MILMFFSIEHDYELVITKFSGLLCRRVEKRLSKKLSSRINVKSDLELTLDRIKSVTRSTIFPPTEKNL